MTLTRERVVEVSYIEECDFHDWLHRECLKVVVEERSIDLRGRDGHGHLPRFWAEIPNAEIKGNGVLLSVTGNGETVDGAVRDLAAKTSERLLVLNAYQPQRRELRTPRLTWSI
jgi:hypothetical protein